MFPEASDLASWQWKGSTMRLKLTSLVGGLVAAIAAIFIIAAVSAPAQALTLSSASSTSTHVSLRPAATQVSLRPATTQKVTATVRCGKFVGTIIHVGSGGIFSRATLEVKGDLTSSCNSKTYLEVRYDTDVESFPGTIIASVGARGKKDVDWQTHSLEPFGHIGIRVGTTDGMKDGKILWGKWVNV
jgi:hypothetical protein